MSRLIEGLFAFDAENVRRMLLLLLQSQLLLLLRRADLQLESSNLRLQSRFLFGLDRGLGVLANVIGIGGTGICRLVADRH